ncbi:hypothetical protein Pan97_20180 [Bremerella volcania]|uniref:Uncharacterized protein n=1 Tax=Bremerella volcania TaxID=2527984 RepID=A0A518C6Z7_9BACT|nr:hypothetical protein [Bremerella volcania]QDU74998.1 hypothetical protein Pan97_20180 [Bremerella volcania]
MNRLSFRETVSNLGLGTLFLTALGLTFLFQGSGQGEPSAEELIIYPATHKSAYPVCLNDTWAVWATSEVISAVPTRRGPDYLHRYYRQRLGEQDARYAYQAVYGSGVVPPVEIQESGLITHSTYNRLTWYDVDGQVHSPKEEIHGITSVYSDGVIQKKSHSTRDARGEHVVWIPFDGFQLDQQREFELAPIGKETQWVPYRNIRSGDVLLWMSPESLHLVDLSSQTEKVVPIGDPDLNEYERKHSRFTAFDDGLLLLDDDYVIDVQTGKRVTSYRDDKRIHGLFMMKHRVGYRIHEANLEAIDLSNPNAPPRKLHSFDKIAKLFPNDSGLLFWTGSEWKTIPWVQFARR